MKSSSRDSGDGDLQEEGDWRAFRALLVQHEDKGDRGQLSAPSLEKATTDDTHWAYDAGMNVEVGTILLSIPTTDLCQALEQQYFHRCVVLVTHWDENGIRGILLNRPTAFSYKAADDDYEWSLWFGGDMYETNIDDDSEIMCLHALTSREARDASEPICKGLWRTSLIQARALVNDGVATPGDFWCFGGHCKWFPGQLEKEMGEERGEWYAASLDGPSILEELRHQAQAGATAGVDMWELLIDRIDKDDLAVSHIPKGQLRFYDRMLQAWVNSNLVLTADECVTANTSSNAVNIRPGTILRATMQSKTSSCPPFLLSDQDFHRSLILVLKETELTTVGVHLNLPLNGVIEVSDDISLPVRYGGLIDPDETDQDEDDSFLWVHRCPTLREGEPLGNSGIWSINEDGAVEALQSGDLSPEDVMVFSGICVWENDNLNIQVAVAETMQIVPPGNLARIWDVLSRQKVLTRKTLESNVATAIAAWEAADNGEDPASQSAVAKDDVLLADAALRAWAAVSLLDAPKTTLIEVLEG